MTKSDWLSERVIFGILIIGGYFGVGAVMIVLSHWGALPQSIVDMTHDMYLTVGPLLGLIVQSIWRNDKTDKLNAQTTATLAAAVSPASTAPGPTVVARSEGEAPSEGQEAPPATPAANQSATVNPNPTATPKPTTPTPAPTPHAFLGAGA